MVTEASGERLEGVLKELKKFEENIKRLVDQLEKIGDSSSLKSEDSQKFEHAKGYLSAIHGNVSNIVKSLATPHVLAKPSVQGPPMIVRCKQWEDFKFNALKADTVSFLHRDGERVFQVDAIKEGKVYTYSGQLPRDFEFLRVWLSKQVDIDEDRVLEGILALG